jgi:hypothetical protein
MGGRLRRNPQWWRLYRANLAVIHAEQQRKARSDPEWARRVADRIPGPDFIFPGTFLILPEEEAWSGRRSRAKVPAVSLTPSRRARILGGAEHAVLASDWRKEPAWSNMPPGNPELGSDQFLALFASVRFAFDHS